MTILGSIFSGALLLYIISRFTHYLRETSTHSAELTSTHHPATVQTQTFQCAPDLPSTSQTLTDHTATDHHPSYNPNKANSHTEAQPASGFSSCCCCEYPDCNLKQMCAPHNIYQEEDSGLPFALWFTYGSAVGQGNSLFHCFLNMTLMLIGLLLLYSFSMDYSVFLQVKISTM